MPKQYTPRLSVEMDQDLKDRLNRLIQWGRLKHVIGAILEDLVETLEPLSPSDRELAIAAIVAKMLKPKDFLETLQNEPH